jgi:xanthine phosphoribosyltransferase
VENIIERLKNRIISEAILIKPNIINVSTFLNHQVDVKFMYELADVFIEHFSLKENTKIDRVITIEASGIIPAGLVALKLGVPLIYAKKKVPSTLGTDVYQRVVYSMTRGENVLITVAKRFLNKGDNALIIDDFLAKGGTAKGLIAILKEAGVNIAGYGVIIEKTFEKGRINIESENIDFYSIIKIKSIENGIVFE